MEQRFGRYQLREMLGRGGMGEVHLAFDPHLEREVAVKTLRSEGLAEQVRARFLAEARALARVTVPQVVQVHDLDLGHQPPFLVMELVRGRSLHHLRAQGLRFTAAQAIDCASQVLRGLMSAHAAGVLHRDLKPANILRGEQGLYKLVDFGLAILAGGERLTGECEVVGTLRYLAPEVATGAEHSVRSDLYGLGVTLVEMVSGSTPHADTQGSLLLLKRVAAGLPPSAVELPGLPPALQAWLGRLVATVPEQRFASAAEALAALDGIDAGTPAAPPPAAVAGDSTAAIPVATGSPSTLRPMVRPDAPSGVSAGSPRPHFGFFTKLALALWLVASLGTAAAGVVLHQRMIAVQMDGLRGQLRQIAAAAAMLIDPVAHDRITAATATADPGYVALRDRLRALQEASEGIKFIYTMRQRPDTAATGVVEFVVDAQLAEDQDGNGVIDPPEEPAHPGKPYQSRQAKHLLDGFTAITTEDEVYTDQWGTLLSGYAPIRRADGSVAGLVGVDIAADRIDAIKAATWQQMLVLQGLLLVAFLAAALLIARRFDRPVQELSRAMQAIASGDLHPRLPPAGQDEFGILARTLGQLAADLRTAAAMRSALERTLAGSLAGRASAAGGSGAVLHLAVHLRTPAALEVLGRRLPAVVDAVHRLGGTVEGLPGRGVLARFPEQGPGDAPAERALRAGLAALASLHAEGADLEAGGAVALGDLESAASRARRLVLAGRHRGDLLADGPLQAMVRRHFFADAVVLADGEQVFAVKGAVAA
ncbi:MAG: hypothetical protein RLZZ127_1835 [Planctomycetota bacterium]|jgi:HAMP domain-containing protein